MADGAGLWLDILIDKRLLSLSALAAFFRVNRDCCERLASRGFDYTLARICVRLGKAGSEGGELALRLSRRLSLLTSPEPPPRLGWADCTRRFLERIFDVHDQLQKRSKGSADHLLLHAMGEPVESTVRVSAEGMSWALHSSISEEPDGWKIYWEGPDDRMHRCVGSLRVAHGGLICHSGGWNGKVLVDGQRLVEWRVDLGTPNFVADKFGKILTEDVDSAVRRWKPRNDPHLMRVSTKGDLVAVTRKFYPDYGHSLGDAQQKWLVYDGRRVRWIPRQDDGVRWNDFKFSPDSSLILAGGNNTAIPVYDGLHRPVFVNTCDGTVKVMDLQGRARLQFMCKSEVLSVSFSHDGSAIVTGTLERSQGVEANRTEVGMKPCSGYMQVWRFDPGEGMVQTGPPTILPGHTSGVVTLEMSRSGKRLVSASLDGKVILWDVEGGWKALCVLQGEGDFIDLFSWSRDEELVAGGPAHGDRVVVWDVRHGRNALLRASFRHVLHTSRRRAVVTGLAFCWGEGEGEWLVSGNSEGLIRVWDVHN